MKKHKPISRFLIIALAVLCALFASKDNLLAYSGVEQKLQTTSAKMVSMNITSWPSTAYGPGSTFESDKVAAEIVYSNGSKKTVRTPELKLSWNGYYKGSLDNMIGNKTNISSENEGYITVSYTDGTTTVKHSKRIIIYSWAQKVNGSTSTATPTATPTAKPTSTPTAKPTAAPPSTPSADSGKTDTAKKVYKFTITSWPTTSYGPGSQFETSKVAAEVVYTDGSKKTVSSSELKFAWNGYYKGSLDNMIGNKTNSSTENEGYITITYNEGTTVVRSTKRVIIYSWGQKVTDSSSQPTAAPTATPTAKPTAAPTSTPTAKPTAAPTAAPTSTPSSDSGKSDTVKKVYKFTITSWPTTSYGPGSQFETSKVAAEVIYTDGSKKTVSSSELKFTWNGYYQGSLNNMIGNKTNSSTENEGYITVTYNEGTTVVKSTKRIIIYSWGQKITDSSNTDSKPTTEPTAAPTTVPTAAPTSTPTATPDNNTNGKGQYAAPVAGDATVIINTMTVGWNLGGAFDNTAPFVLPSALNRTSDEGVAYETMDNRPLITYDMIKAIHDKGFNTIRIPVTWNHHLIDDGNGNVTISKPFLDEVKRIVNYAYSLNMYVIINSHHDASDYSNGKTMAQAGDTGLTWEMNVPYQLYTAGDNVSNESQCENVERLWTAIANEFKDYDNRLMFEGLNEVQGNNRNWETPSAAALTRLNNLNNAFVKAVRATGGNNSSRVLLVQTYAGSFEDYAVKAVSINDSAKNAIIEEVHIFTDAMDEKLESKMSTVVANAQYPVIIGEFGFKWQYNNISNLAKWYNNASKLSKKYHLPLIYWDDGDMRHHHYGIFNRSSLSWLKEGTDIAASALSGYYDN